MKVTAIISSRWNSTRLPGKALAVIGQKPILQHVVDRLRNSAIVNDIVVATTESSMPIVEYCVRNHIHVFISSNTNVIDEENLILRMVQCGDKFDADIVVRIWGDCPFIDASLIDEGLTYFLKHEYDYLYPVNLTKGLSFTIYRHKEFVKLYHIMSEGDRWYWNWVDELKPWQKNGFKVFLYDFKMKYDRVKGLNINTPADLSDANKVIDAYGEHVKNLDFIEMLGEEK